MIAIKSSCPIINSQVMKPSIAFSRLNMRPVKKPTVYIVNYTFPEIPTICIPILEIIFEKDVPLRVFQHWSNS